MTETVKILFFFYFKFDTIMTSVSEVQSLISVQFSKTKRPYKTDIDLIQYSLLDLEVLQSY